MARTARVNGKTVITIGGNGWDATMGAITKARKNYLFGTDEPERQNKVRDVFTRNACSETIERCENFINSAKADPAAVDTAVHMGMIKVAPTGHRYIQLG